jgi:SAM-dependent methyltransferase
MKEIANQLIKSFPLPIQKLVADMYIIMINMSFSKVIMTMLYHAYWYKITNKCFEGLHLGSGNNRIPAFCNIDMNIRCKCDVISNIEKLKLGPETVGAIYCSHVFEHIPQKKAKYVLTEWYRVLNKGGILYICVPNIENLFHIYLDNLPNYEIDEVRNVVDLSCGVIYGGQINKYDYHFYGYSFTTLCSLLKSVGFRKVQLFDRARIDLFPSRDASFATVDGVPVSLNIEAIK